jgi:hypothetical protein
MSVSFSLSLYFSLSLCKAMSVSQYVHAYVRLHVCSCMRPVLRVLVLLWITMDNVRPLCFVLSFLLPQ